MGIKTEGARSDWLGFLNNLQLKTGILIDVDMRMEFSNAVLTSHDSVICLCEIWLKEDINSKELLLNNYDIFPRER